MSGSPVPAQINAGDTVAAEYPLPTIADLYTPAGEFATAWKLLFENLDPGQGVTTLAGKATDEKLVFLSDEGLPSGSYRWRLVADITGEQVVGTRRITALEGYIVVIQPEVKASFARRMIPILENLYETRASGRGDVINYMVAGRSYTSMSMRELRNEINFFKETARQAEGKTAWKQWSAPFGG